MHRERPLPRRGGLHPASRHLPHAVPRPLLAPCGIPPPLPSTPAGPKRYIHMSYREPPPSTAACDFEWARGRLFDEHVAATLYEVGWLGWLAGLVGWLVGCIGWLGWLIG